ncbi:FadR/GntR family transcriptional regulator [Novosphingobium colocasiae]|uniref:GntR family transcriptional regulator n=1 Tax=Novosphingobium colocasiae TaxID=1256513 RepID=A0A918PA05_9SPHN|nr:FadR/GntR family transcriptional regulator [Novosphingobium colocasiae]GGY93289.1 GntR family transcriptional regulator [Novosphingobium colocasiae]
MGHNTQPTLSRVVVPKASEALAEQIRNLIVAGTFQPGEMLPAERDLIVETGLSRTTIRDALRILESRGLIVTKPGRAGGSMVTLPGRDSISRSVELFVRTHGIKLSSLLECRVAVEPALARLAALNRTDAQLAEMTELHEQFVQSIDNVTRYKRVNLDWHLAIARASHNEPLMALIEAITMPIREAMDYRDVTTPEIRASAIKSHTKIMEAIRTQDGDAAFNRMNRHVSAYRDISAERLGDNPGPG